MTDGFEPQVIPDVPIPLLGLTIPNTSMQSPTPSQGSSAGIEPPVIKNNVIAIPPIAIDTVGTSLDTAQKKILGSFTFGQIGSLQIGKYVNGVSGELDLSPAGITAKNVNGVTTFAIDGTTGNATFLGTIQAGTLIAGDSAVTISGSSAGGTIVVLSGGLPAIVIGNV